MNTKKFLFGLLTIGILSGAACTTDNSDLYEQSVKRKHVRIKPDKKAVERKHVRIKPDKQDKQAVERKHVRIKPDPKS